MGVYPISGQNLIYETDDKIFTLTEVMCSRWRTPPTEEETLTEWIQKGELRVYNIVGSLPQLQWAKTRLQRIFPWESTGEQHRDAVIPETDLLAFEKRHPECLGKELKKVAQEGAQGAKADIETRVEKSWIKVCNAILRYAGKDISNPNIRGEIKKFLDLDEKTAKKYFDKIQCVMDNKTE